MKFSTAAAVILSITSCMTPCAGFSSSSPEQRQRRATELQANRRTILTSFLATAAASLLLSSPAVADDMFSKKNPLTNSVLEQMRIMDQDFSDNIKYNGELESGSAGNKGKVDAYPTLLVPIVEISQELNKVESLTKSSSPDDWKQAREILSNPRHFDKLAFKKIFNAYGDNIYYNDPDRANVYLGGGATPKNEQSMAYLLRNDVLNNVESLQAELDYLLKPGVMESTDDLMGYAKTAKGAMDKYLTIVPPNEMKRALELMEGTTSQ